MTIGDSHPCRFSHPYTSSSVPNNAKSTSMCCAGEIARANVPGVRAKTSVPGARTLSARVKTLRVPRLSAHLQRPHPHVVGPEQTGALVLDSRDLAVVPLRLVPTHRQGFGCPYPHQLSLVLVVAQCGLVLGNGSPLGGHLR